MFLPPSFKVVTCGLPLCLGCVAAHIQGIRVRHVAWFVLTQLMGKMQSSLGGQVWKIELGSDPG